MAIFCSHIKSRTTGLSRIWATLPGGILALIVASLALLLSTNPIAAQEPPSAEHPVSMQLVSLHDSLDRSDSAAQLHTTVGVEFTIEPGWHIYWENSGDSATPTKIDWTVSNGWRASPVRWPTPWRFIERGDMTTFGYKNSVLLPSVISAEAPGAYSDDLLQVTARAKWLVCKDVCIPGKGEATTTISLATTTALNSNAERIQVTEQQLPRAEHGPISIESQSYFIPTRPEGSNSAAGGANYEMLLTVKGLRNTEQHPAHVQFFPGPSDLVTAGKPTVAWNEGLLFVRAPLHLAPKAPTPPQLRGILAISEVHADTAVSIEWSLPEELKKTPTAPPAVAFAETTYRLVHWSDADKAHSGTSTATDATSSASWAELALVTFFAFLGGLLLNLMPCVLPIIAIKVMSFVDHAKGSSQGSAGAFCSGIISTCLVLGLIVILLRSLGVQLGWGFQFQHPEFVLGLTIIVFFLSLGFFDLYTVALPFVRQCCTAVDALPPSRSRHFFDGVIATILSTPCTAPFLGTALVVAFTRGPLVTLLIHLAIGLGLACPYFILARNPKLLSLLPKPGTWMQRLRQFLGFLLLGTVLWLLFVLQKLTGSGVVWCLLLLLLILFALWLYDWAREATARRALSLRVAASITLVASHIWLFPKIVAPAPSGALQPTGGAGTSTAAGEIAWRPFSMEAVNASLAEGKPVFIDFTADWCITCKANEFLIINTADVRAAIIEYNVSPLIADWTRGDQHITEALSKYGARGVPLYVVLSPKAPNEPVVLSTIPSKDALIGAFRTAARGTTH